MYLGMVRRSLRKIFFLGLILTGSSYSSYSQLLDTLYYNEYWQLVADDSAKQYRIAEVDTINLWFTGRFQDFNADGSLFMEGQYSKSGLKNGPFKIYYPNGQLYSAGFFDNDQLSGIWYYYTLEGKLRERINFTGYDFLVLDSFDKEGNHVVYNSTGNWVKEFRSANSSMLTASGRYYQKKRVGKWKIVDQTGEPILIESYSNDYFVQGTLYKPTLRNYRESRFTSELFYPSSLRAIESFNVWDARRSDYPYLTWLPVEKDSSATTEAIIDPPDRPAQYPLGMGVFYKKVSQILVYPKLARDKSIEGKVYVQFIVGTDGFLYDAQVLRGIGGGCDQQAVIAVLAAGRWFPAQKKGSLVEQRVVIPISFRLKQ